MLSRRRFATAFAGMAAATSLASCSREEPPAPVARTDLRAGSGKNTVLGPVKQIELGLLNVGYAEFGPATGRPVLLLHGWPYDAWSYADVAPLLAAEGHRVIVPYLRGYGPTTFLSAQTVRNGQQSAVALDIIALMDALGIENAVLGGFDWGARTVAVIVALWLERCTAIVSVSGYLVTNLVANQQPLPPAAEQGWWYQYYFATERGVLGYQQNRRDFNELIWRSASPQWNFDRATYERTAASFDNPDHGDIVIHNYRWRLGLAPGEPQYDVHEQKLATAPSISVPAITIGSDFDGPRADGMSYRDKFTGRYAHRVFAGIGHNVPQEAPEAFAQAMMDAVRL